jgi:hypothetical protein
LTARHLQRTEETSVSDGDGFFPREPANELALVRRRGGCARRGEQIAQIEMYMRTGRVNIDV